MMTVQVLNSTVLSEKMTILKTREMPREMPRERKKRVSS